jgi:hypothetical protein
MFFKKYLVVTVLTIGTAINKTDLLLQLQTRITSLEARVDALEANTPLIVIAAGDIAADGTMLRSYNVDSVMWSTNRYVISITGVDYHYAQYVTMITPSTGVTAREGSVGGDLLVYVFDSAGSAQQGIFQFVTYRIP